MACVLTKLNEIQRYFIFCFTLLVFIFSTACSGFAKEAVSLTVLFDKLYYSTGDSFTAKIHLINTSDEPIKHAKITLKIKRPPTQKTRYRSKVLFARTWSYTLRKKKTTLTLTRRIRSLGLREGAYPTVVTVKSGRQVLSEASSSLVVVNVRPTPPVILILVWDLGSQICFNPNGVFISERIQKDLNRNSRKPGIYWQHFSALKRHSQTRVNMNITPIVLEQINEIKDGYRLKKNGKVKAISSRTRQSKHAKEFLEELREFTRSKQIELIPAPYAYSSIPLLAGMDWDKDAFFQIERGRKSVEEVVGSKQEVRGLYPPGLALDSDSLSYLSGSQISYTILDQSLFKNLYQVKGDIYSPYQIQNIHGSKIVAFFRDSYASEVVVGQDHRMMRVQKLLGSCALAYLSSRKQQILVVVADGRKVDAKFLDSLYSSLEEIPWVNTATLTEAKERHPPSDKVYTLSYTGTGSYNRDYFNQLKIAREKLNLFISIVPQPNSLKARLIKNFLVAESSNWTNKGENLELGLSFIDDVRSRAETELKKIVLAKSGVITLAGRSGKIPISVENKADYQMRVAIRVEGKGVNFPDGRQKVVILHPRENLFTFPVEVKAGTSTPVKVYICSKDKVIRQATLVVKTASASREVIYLVSALLALGVGIFISLRLREAKKRKVSTEVNLK